MSHQTTTIVIAVICGTLAVSAYVAWIAIPAWTSYSKVWERVAATFLSLYVLAGLLVVGAGGGAAIAWYWDRIAA